MLRRTCVGLALAALLAAAPALAQGAPTSWEGRGVVREIRAERRTVVLRHEAIPGLMRAMTMPFRVRDAAMLDGLSEGDRVTFTLRRRAEGGYVLTRLDRAPPASDEPRRRGKPSRHRAKGRAMTDAIASLAARLR